MNNVLESSLFMKGPCFIDEFSASIYMYLSLTVKLDIFGFLFLVCEVKQHLANLNSKCELLIHCNLFEIQDSM